MPTPNPVRESRSSESLLRAAESDGLPIVGVTLDGCVLVVVEFAHDRSRIRLPECSAGDAAAGRASLRLRSATGCEASEFMLLTPFGSPIGRFHLPAVLLAPGVRTTPGRPGNVVLVPFWDASRWLSERAVHGDDVDPAALFAMRQAERRLPAWALSRLRASLAAPSRSQTATAASGPVPDLALSGPTATVARARAPRS